MSLFITDFSRRTSVAVSVRLRKDYAWSKNTWADQMKILCLIPCFGEKIPCSNGGNSLFRKETGNLWQASQIPM